MKIYKYGIALFAISSFLCGISPNIHSLIAFRALQGLGAAMMQATSIAVITATLEKEEIAKAIGILGMLMGLGPTLGPVLGGFILSGIGWQWIFWLNIPICLYAWYGCLRLQTHNEILHKTSLDYYNLTLFGISILLLLLGMSYVEKNAELALLLFITMIISFGIHLLIELRSSHPVIKYELFSQINFSAPIIGVIAMGGATAIVFILPPLFFEKLRHFTTWQVGLVSFSSPLGIVIISRIYGKFKNIFGTELPLIIGIFLMTIPLFILTKIDINWSAYFIFILLIIYGLGAGLFMTSNIAYLTSQFPVQKQAFVSSLIRMVQNAAIALGAAGSALLVSIKSQANNLNILLGIRHAWQLAAIMTFIALIALINMHIKAKKKYYEIR